MRVFSLDRTMFGGVSLVDNKAAVEATTSRQRQNNIHGHQLDHVSLRKRDETGEPPVGASPIHTQEIVDGC